MIGADTTFLVQLAVTDLPEYPQANALLEHEVIDSGEMLALAPQVINEFVHTVTDPKRFRRPMSILAAIDFAELRWNAAEVQHVFPTSDSARLFLRWLRDRRLGRKRLLDTELAATLWAADVRRIATSNARDFGVFGFDVLMP